MAFRSVRMRVFNMTTSRLILTVPPGALQHGRVTKDPPTLLDPDQFGEWEAESDGDIPIIGSVATGTEGSLTYSVDGHGDTIHLFWDNPAVGPARFQHWTPHGPGGEELSADFKFFPLHIAIDESSEPPPGQDGPVIAVTEGDLDDDGLILPFPGQRDPMPHAWFDIGLRNIHEPVNMRSWLKALGLDPNQGLSQIKLKQFSVMQLVDLPI
jgi:hypothetical protein